MNDFERKWELIREQLRAEATGDAPPRISSGRTLFGIKSEAEEKMERFAREIEEENRRKSLEGRRKREAGEPSGQESARGAEGDRCEGAKAAEDRNGRRNARGAECNDSAAAKGSEPKEARRPEGDAR